MEDSEPDQWETDLDAASALTDRVVATAVGAPVVSVRRWRDRTAVPSDSRIHRLSRLAEFVRRDEEASRDPQKRLSRRLRFPDTRLSPVSVADVLLVGGIDPARRCADDPAQDQSVLSELFPRCRPVDDGLTRISLANGKFTVRLQELGISVSGTDAAVLRARMVARVRKRLKSSSEPSTRVEKSVLDRLARSAAARPGSSTPSLEEVLFGSWIGED